MTMGIEATRKLHKKLATSNQRKETHIQTIEMDRCTRK